MMNIDIKQLPSYCITLGGARKSKARRRFARLGLSVEFADGCKDDNAYKGCFLAHHQLLTSGIKPPFIVFEDDAAPVEWGGGIQTEFTIPGDADAFYLGLSIAGKEGKPGTIRYHSVSTDLIRIESMIQSHAIIYVSERFHQAAIAYLAKHLVADEFPSDMILGSGQSEFNVYAPHAAVFAQDNRKFWGWTAIRLPYKAGASHG